MLESSGEPSYRRLKLARGELGKGEEEQEEE